MCESLTNTSICEHVTFVRMKVKNLSTFSFTCGWFGVDQNQTYSRRNESAVKNSRCAVLRDRYTSKGLASRRSIRRLRNVISSASIDLVVEPSRRRNYRHAVRTAGYPLVEDYTRTSQRNRAARNRISCRAERPAAARAERAASTNSTPLSMLAAVAAAGRSDVKMTSR